MWGSIYIAGFVAFSYFGRDVLITARDSYAKLAFFLVLLCWPITAALYLFSRLARLVR